jgi:PAS domain S-box-containing protein
MKTKSEKLKRDAVIQRNLIRAILNNLPMITYLNDKNSRYVCGNTKCAEVFNCPEENATEEEVEELYERYATREHLEEDAFIIRTKFPIHYTRRFAYGGGADIWYKVHKSPVFDEHNEIAGIVTTMEDIEAEMNIINQRESYIATLTHDLKIPTLAQIRSLEMLLDGTFGELTPEQKGITQLTLDSCNYMLEMVSTILSTYKYENGEIALEPKNFNIAELTEEVCKEVCHFAADKHVNIIIKPDLRSGIVYADKMQIKRVVTNLLSNSIAYAREDSEVTVEIEQGEDGIVEYLVKNKSSYIQPAVMKDIFNKYVTHKSKYNKVGIGLGLYLSRQIIEKHGGSMIAQSSPGEENIFGFRLVRTSAHKPDCCPAC